jgi:hypothetical protein
MTDTKFQASAVNLATDATTVSTVNSLLRGIHVQVSLSAHACPIKDGASGTTLFTIPASAFAGSWFEAGDMRFPSGIYVDPDNSGTGTVTVVYKAEQNFEGY